MAIIHYEHITVPSLDETAGDGFYVRLDGANMPTAGYPIKYYTTRALCEANLVDGGIALYSDEDDGLTYLAVRLGSSIRAIQIGS